MQKEPKACCHIIDTIKKLPLEEAEHMRRVGVLAGLLTEKAFLHGGCGGMDEWIGHEHFGEAASYHDIGKVWIPKEILLKPGKLTMQEKLIVQLHPVYAKVWSELVMSGAVSGMPEYLMPVVFRSAEYHHERWDGNGYPHGIGMEEIPLIARITAICDVYDTITSIRAYKKAMSHDTACSELLKNAGTQFDPHLTEIFLQNEPAFAQLKSKQTA